MKTSRFSTGLFLIIAMGLTWTAAAEAMPLDAAATERLVAESGGTARIGMHRAPGLEVMEGVGHYPHCEAPDRFVASLTEFIESTRPARIKVSRKQMLRSVSR